MSHDQIKYTVGTTILKGVAKRPRKDRINFEYQAEEHISDTVSNVIIVKLHDAQE